MTIERAERSARRFLNDTEFYAGIWADVVELAEEFLSLRRQYEELKEKYESQKYYYTHSESYVGYKGRRM